jgi:hypothetical protein
MRPPANPDRTPARYALFIGGYLLTDQDIAVLVVPTAVPIKE